MQPIVIHQLVALWKGRQLAPDTIKLRLQHLAQAVVFVGSNYCPKRHPWTQPHKTQLKEWYRKLCALALHDCRLQPRKVYNQHLWEAWEAARSAYRQFLGAFEVCC